VRENVEFGPKAIVVIAQIENVCGAGLIGIVLATVISLTLAGVTSAKLGRALSGIINDM
jgi:hypothetical protein